MPESHGRHIYVSYSMSRQKLLFQPIAVIVPDYDLFGPSNFFPTLGPDHWRERCDAKKVMSLYLEALRSAPAQVWIGF